MSIITKNAAGANVTYTIFRKDSDVASYVGANHSDVSKDIIVVKSVSPKQTLSAYGNRRSTVNYLVTVSTANPDGTTTAKDLKLEVSASIPAGVSFATFKEALQRQGNMLIDDAIAGDLFHLGKIDR
nr:MAG: hypothetical protein 2 [Leviviridae sp.]